jgi:4-amino-4-deoxy-L-arabinose transferase-like glycosyltransferase
MTDAEKEAKAEAKADADAKADAKAEAKAKTKADADADADADAKDDAAEEKPERATKDEKKDEEKPSRKLPQIPAWAVAVGLPVLFFFIVPPLAKSGIWDPYELNVADLARRVALNLHGASSLRLEGTDNSLPHLNDLGRPQLPFTAMAIGFSLFGLHEWAGRLPLAIFGLLGVVATYGWVSRLVDKRAGAFAAVALTTTPLYFVQARTMLGDIVTMAALSMSFGGLAVAAFDRHAKENSTHRFAYLGLAVLGLVCGLESRGGMIGLGIPLGAIGLSWFVLLASGQKRADIFTDVIGALSLAVAAVVVYKAVSVLDQEKVPDLSMWIGAMTRVGPGKYPTFDYFIAHIGHAMVPWSAFVPFALGRMFIAPKGRVGVDVERESITRMLLLVGAAVAFGIHGWLASRTELVAFSAPAILAAVCGVALRDYERGAHPSIAVGVGTAVFLGLFHHDMHQMPEKAFQAFAVVGGTFPESFKTQALNLWTVVLVGFAGISFLTWVDRDALEGVVSTVSTAADPAAPNDPRAARTPHKPFDPKGYARLVTRLLEAWDGMLALIYLAVVAGACLAGLAVWAGQRGGWKWLPVIGSQTKDIVLNAWWVSAFVPLAAILGTYFWYDVWVWAFRTKKEPTFASATRGFEPLEDLAAEMIGKGEALKKPAWTVLIEELRKDDDDPKKKEADEKAKKKDGEEDDDAEAKVNADVAEATPVEPPRPKGEPSNFAIALVTLVVLVPLMYLQVPLAVFVGLAKAGVRTLAAIAIALPSGVGVFLLLGLLSDVVRGSRAAFMALSATLLSAVLCFSYYPALANQLSPKEVFESYQHMKKADEPLGLLGVGGRTSAYYAGGQPPNFKDAQSAFTWMSSAEPGTRRFLATTNNELARLNSLYRAQQGKTRGNVPVLDARSSQILLVASYLEPNEKNENPLSKVILPEPPKPQHKLDVNMEDTLQVLGYDLVDEDSNKFVDTITPRKKYRLRTYYKVLAPVTREWEPFIHIDGYHRRHNGDHKMVDGKYPYALWQVGDYIADDYELSLEPNFGPGAYTLYFGLFLGDARLKIKSGPSDSENRVNGGLLHVK